MTRLRVGPIHLILIAALGLSGCGALGVHSPRLACGPLNHDEVPRTAADASRIGRQYLANIFAEPSVLRQEPFTVTFDDYRWVVRGTLPPGETHGRFLVVIDAKTGCSTFRGVDDEVRP
jgi:hypothetical protein